MVTLSKEVQRVAEAEGMELSTVRKMVERSAVYRDPRGNRRFYDWLFQVENGEVQRMCYLTKRTIEQPKDATKLPEECLTCEGEGCKECGWNGSLRVIRK